MPTGWASRRAWAWRWRRRRPRTAPWQTRHSRGWTSPPCAPALAALSGVPGSPQPRTAGWQRVQSCQAHLGTAAPAACGCPSPRPTCTGPLGSPSPRPSLLSAPPQATGGSACWATPRRCPGRGSPPGRRSTCATLTCAAGTRAPGCACTCSTLRQIMRTACSAGSTLLQATLPPAPSQRALRWWARTGGPPGAGSPRLRSRCGNTLSGQ
mmetsp:Transcript_33626/g.87206  ORF Transcript_33626/g.87206 Transcript_33626/m.87206 type:complete len:210 (+) Transcript_33626:1267-1896(+)